MDVTVYPPNDLINYAKGKPTGPSMKLKLNEEGISAWSFETKGTGRHTAVLKGEYEMTRLN